MPDIPAAAGVYVIYFGEEIVYIGQSNNMRARFARHNVRYGYWREIITPWGEISADISVTAKIRISRRYGDWAMWELRLIHRLKPKFNGTFVTKRSARRKVA
jgi:excinuclease UvrABC nuclease subunit